jgi:hypothetical protein
MLSLNILFTLLKILALKVNKFTNKLSTLIDLLPSEIDILLQ